MAMNPKILTYLQVMRESYKNKSFDEIVNLGWISEVPINIDGTKYYPAIWGSEFQDNALLVVQLTRWYIVNWFGTTDAIGFTLNEKGALTEVDANWLMNVVGHP